MNQCKLSFSKHANDRLYKLCRINYKKAEKMFCILIPNFIVLAIIW